MLPTASNNPVLLWPGVLAGDDYNAGSGGTPVTVGVHVEATSSASAKSYGAATSSGHAEGTSASSATAKGEALTSGHAEGVSSVHAAFAEPTPVTVGVHVEGTSSVNASASVGSAVIIDLWQGDGGWQTTPRARKPKPKPTPAVIAANSLEARASIHAIAGGQALASARVLGVSSVTAAAIGYVGPSDEEVARALLLIYGRAA